MTLPLGARVHNNGWSFSVWAPKADTVEVVLYDGPERETRRLPMLRGERGYFELTTDTVSKNTLYKYALHTRENGGSRSLGVYPDPASRSQPFGVHGPSRCVALPSPLATGPNLQLRDLIIYELHVSTFTPEGTLSAIARELPRLVDLGVNMIDLMPLAQTPGSRNWGYDGVYPFSVHHRYGGPEALFQFVQNAHAVGVGVMLDVVYNHLGPEGNYLPAFGPYFNPSVGTPWGPALNFEAAQSDEVRRFFLSSAEQWITEFDVDGLRLDAVHEIQDRRAISFLAELNELVHERAASRGKTVTVLAESDANDPRYVMPTSQLGHGCDVMYAEDLHHALHVALTGETSGYYQDFADLEHVARALRTGVSYHGQYAPSRQRRHGRPISGVAPEHLLVFSQNHDQVGNRAAGERLTTIAGLDAQRAAALVVLASPYTPFLFMGEEYGETAPFQYFVEHGDPKLIEAVRKGRRDEFAQFGWQIEVPDPLAESTFARSRLNPGLSSKPEHAGVLATYRSLISLRREMRARMDATADNVRAAVVLPGTRVLRFTRGPGEVMVAYVNLGAEPASVRIELQSTGYAKRVDLADTALGGSGATVHASPENGATLKLPAFGGVIYVRAS